MNLSQFLSFGYWFDTAPISDFRYLDLLTWIILGLFVLAIIVQLSGKFFTMHPVVRRFVKRLPGAMYLASIVAAFLVFARYQRAPYLSMRIWLLLTFGILLVWFVVILVKFFQNYTREVAAFSKRKENKKKKKKLKTVRNS